MACANPDPNLMAALCSACPTCETEDTDSATTDFCQNMQLLVQRKLKELMSCGPGPIRIGDVYYENFSTALKALQEFASWLSEYCSQLDDGPVMESVYQNKCTGWGPCPRCHSHACRCNHS
jgi:hypothetical protein